MTPAALHVFLAVVLPVWLLAFAAVAVMISVDRRRRRRTPQFRPLDARAYSGRAFLVADDEEGGWIAVAYWTGEFWAYALPTDLVEQIEFEPTRYRETAP